jgi:hypothetical protein
MTVIEKTSAPTSQSSTTVAHTAPLRDEGVTNLPSSPSHTRKSLQMMLAATALGLGIGHTPKATAQENDSPLQTSHFKQPFMGELNKEVLPEPVSDQQSFSIPKDWLQPAPSPTLPPLESEIYRTKFPLVESSPDYQRFILSSFTLKGTTETDIHLLFPAEPKRILYLPQIAQQALRLVEKHHNFVPKSATFDTARGELTFTKGDQQFVASAEYILARKDDRDYRLKLESQTAKETKELSDAIAAIFEDSGRTWSFENGFEQLKLYSQTNRMFGERIASELKEHGKEYYSSDQAVILDIEERDLLSNGLRSEVDTWVSGAKQRWEQRAALFELKSRADSLADAKASLVALEMFDGHLSDGRAVHGIRNVQEGKEQLSMYTAQGVAVARFSSMKSIDDFPSYRATADWTRTLYDADGSQKTEYYNQSGYPHPYKQLLTNSLGQAVHEEALAPNGTILARKHLLIGTKECFKEDGSFDTLEIEDIKLAFQNIEAVYKQKEGREAIFRLVSHRGEYYLSDYEQYKKHPDAQQILEKAIIAMPIEEVQRHRLALETSLSELVKQEQSEATNKSKQETQVLLDLFRFREKMLEDGLLLARESDATKSYPTLAPQVWNDPRSRNYFSINNEWIDWSSERVQRLMGGNDTPLARSDLKLLISRALYAKNTEPSEQTTQECLQSLERLRNEYSGTSIIKGRNIVFGAHGATLSSPSNGSDISSFIESSGDYHEFGKQTLIDRVRKEQGEGRSFTLIRPEQEKVGTASERARVMTKSGLSSADIAVVEEQFQCRAAASNAPINTHSLYRALEDASVEKETARKIIDEINGGSAALVDECRRIKAEILDRITTTPPPFTFIFEGHGGPDAIYFSDGQLAAGAVPVESQGTTKITADEMAEALRKRQELFGMPKVGEHDIFVFQNCYSSNYVEKLGKALEGGRIPICIGAAEHNQLSLYLRPLDIGSLFMGEVVTSPDDSNSTIGDVLIRQYKDLRNNPFRHHDGSQPEVNTNPIIYVPDQSGVLQHIGFNPNKPKSMTT